MLLVDFRRAATVSAALFLIYNANLRGISSRDTKVTEYLALRLATHGDTRLDEALALRETGLAKGYLQEHGGHVRSNYPLVPALVAAPAYWAAARSGVLDPSHPQSAALEAVGKVVASALTAAACGLLFLLIVERFPGAPAAVIAFSAGLATPLWSSAAQALWSHATAVFFLGLGLWLICRRTPACGSRQAMLAAGGAVGAAVASRVLLLPFLLGLAFGLLRSGTAARRLWWFAVGPLAIGLALGGYNLRTVGSVMGGVAQLESEETHAAAHAVFGAWSGGMIDGLAGLLVSPSRGVLVFSPIVVLAIPGAIRLWKSHPLLRWGVVFPMVCFILGWAKYAVWWGGHSYGPRYAADIILPLAIMSAASFDRPEPFQSRSARFLLVGIAAWSFGVQAIGAFWYPNGEWNGKPQDVDRAHHRLWDWRDSQIPRTLKAGVYRRHLAQLPCVK